MEKENSKMTNKEKIRKKALWRFGELWTDNGKETKTLEYGAGHKYVVLSDFHLGDGSRADNFVQNENVTGKALDFYRNSNYALILLGDLEEFHQFEMEAILKRYQSVYNRFRQFRDLHRIFGNHDVEWALTDPLFADDKRPAVEAIKLQKDDSVDIMLVHGHQASESYEKDLHIVRFGTTFFREIEKIFKLGGKFMFEDKPCFKDKIYASWAMDNKKVLICGHTHCPIFARNFFDYRWVLNNYAEYDKRLRDAKRENNQPEISKYNKLFKWLHEKAITYQNRYNQTGGRGMKKSPGSTLSDYYFNSGGCLFKDAITAIEIDEDWIRLVHWHNQIQERVVMWNKPISGILQGNT
jgi:UDP-2,3-diacylglucosamine pyrophosphatase LpxH